MKEKLTPPSAAKIAEETILENTNAFFDVDFSKAKIAIMMAMKKYHDEIEAYIKQELNENS